MKPAIPVAITRHQAASVLPAQIQKVELLSVVSDGGAMLTKSTVAIKPGSKRVIRVRLPEDSNFWFAFVNKESVMSWNDGADVLVPLDDNPIEGQDTQVEFYYQQTIEEEGFMKEQLQLVGPMFDLPLENVKWNVYVPERWDIGQVAGTLIPTQQSFAISKRISLGSYLESENQRQVVKAKEAESLLALGNKFLQKGEQKRARKAFKSAYQLSQHDQAFNEDARVQLENTKTQQALYGLANRMNWNDQQAANSLPQSKAGFSNFTQKDTQRLLSANGVEDNEMLMQVAEKLVGQHAAAVVPRKSIQASLPEVGRKIVFERPVFVDAWAPIEVSIERASTAKSHGSINWSMLMSIAAVVIVTSASRCRRLL